MYGDVWNVAGRGIKLKRIWHYNSVNESSTSCKDRHREQSGAGTHYYTEIVQTNAVHAVVGVSKKTTPTLQIHTIQTQLDGSGCSYLAFRKAV
jgi:hypothetical protein